MPTPPAPLSCIQENPLIKFQENGQASILNYSLPQQTEFEFTVETEVGVPLEWLSEYATSIPPSNLHSLAKQAVYGQLKNSVENFYKVTLDTYLKQFMIGELTLLTPILK
jgi:hypothetical protein